MGWEVKSLNSLFSFKNGINADKNSYGSGVKFINVMEVINNEFITPDMIPGTVNISDNKKKQYIVRNGDVLFNRTSEVNDEIGLSSIYYGAEEVVFGGFVIHGKPLGNRINDLFKKYCFRIGFVRNQIIKAGQGAVRSNIGQKDLQKVKVILPPLNEQIEIAKALTNWDRAIRKTSQLIEQKKLQKKWLMQQLLTGKKRLNRFSGEWREHSLGDFFTERKETGFKDLELLSVGQNGIYPQSESDKKDTSNSDKSKYKKICPSDIGYNTMRMWQGRSALSSSTGIVSPAYTIVKPKKNAVSEYFAYLFKTPKIINLFWRNSQGLVSDTLNCKFKDFSIVKTKIPDKEEQKAIVNILRLADEELQLLQSKLNQLKAQKRWLMQVLLSGKKRLNF
ncbi:hypothetical protein DN752_13235 [Echinicola strongylocentroti]|uniref:Type I restriction modification DNA specificity domain-containing protein n=2 Tax=Echinicola strongylocentroti TaxID=1795355 RepID=A0A2Z4IQP2_9BACT|nr:hypothetical protein DN752_13235 [Echinicola strongylocentroti]